MLAYLPTCINGREDLSSKSDKFDLRASILDCIYFYFFKSSSYFNLAASLFAVLSALGGIINYYNV
jgi:hypothetical protein